MLVIASDIPTKPSVYLGLSSLSRVLPANSPGSDWCTTQELLLPDNLS